MDREIYKGHNRQNRRKKRELLAANFLRVMAVHESKRGKGKMKSLQTRVSKPREIDEEKKNTTSIR